MIYALLSVCVAYVGQTVTLFVIVRQNERERVRVAGERGELLQRIQAPEVAVAQAIPDGPAGLLHVPLDDFEAFEQDLKENVNGV